MATVASICGDIFALCGLSPAQYDVTAGTDAVDGFRLMSQTQGRDPLDNLLRVYNYFLVEVDGILKLVKRGGGVTLTVTEGDLAARIYQGQESDPPPKVEVKRVQELELPFRVDLSFLSKFRDYEQGTQGAVRYTKLHLQEAITLQADLALTEAFARLVTERILYDQWTAREQFIFALLPRYLQLVPGDVINLPIGSNTFRVRIVQVDVALPGPIQMSAVLDDAAVLTQEAPGGAVTAPGAEDTDVQSTSLIAWSGNALRNDDAASVGLYLAANGAASGFWPGTTVYWSRDGGTSYQELQTLTDPATVGTATSGLAAGTTTGLFDDTNTVDVAITSGPVPTSTSDALVLAGDNVALVGNEVIQYGTVTALGGSNYRLSHLLRGRRGTDGHWGEHASGERVLLIDGGPVQRVVLGAELRGKKLFLKAVGQGQAIADAAATSLLVTGDEYKCYAPGQVVGTRNGPLDLTVTWVRRTRVSVGLQDGYDEPLGESAEAYRLYVRNGVVKTISSPGVTQAAAAVLTSPAHGYSVNDQVLISGVAGMTEINGMVATITAVTTNTLTVNVDSTNFGAWASGGSLEKVLRTISASTPAATYTAAQQVADFGSTQSSVRVVIYMLGLYGNGYMTAATV